MLSRRAFLRYSVGGAAIASLHCGPLSSAHARGASGGITTTPLADDLVLLAGAGANVLALRGPEGLLLVDGGLQEHCAALLKAARKVLSARSVHTLFNTHWHPAQTGCNEKLGKAGTRIIAHENTKLWLGRKIDVRWRDESFGPLPARALPHQTIYTNAQLQFGNETIDYGYLLQAHTDGDIYVLFRNANVLATGDAVTSDRWPLIDWQTGGWIGGLAAGLSKLIQVSDNSTRVIPATGPMLTRADLEMQREMYRKIYERLVKSLTSGLGPQEVIDSAPTKEYRPEWGDPSEFVDMAFRSLWPHFAPDA